MTIALSQPLVRFMLELLNARAIRSLTLPVEKSIELHGALVQAAYLYHVKRVDVLLSLPGHDHVGTILPTRDRTQGSRTTT